MKEKRHSRGSCRSILAPAGFGAGGGGSRRHLASPRGVGEGKPASEVWLHSGISRVSLAPLASKLRQVNLVQVEIVADGCLVPLGRRVGPPPGQDTVLNIPGQLPQGYDTAANDAGELVAASLAPPEALARGEAHVQPQLARGTPQRQPYPFYTHGQTM